MKKIAHNISIDEMIETLQRMKSKGYEFVDATVHSDFDLGLKPANFKKQETEKIVQDFSNLLSLVP